MDGDFVFHIFAKWQEFVKKAKLQNIDLGSGGTYQSMKQYIWLLKKNGLIRKTKQQKASRGGVIPRQYYTFVRQSLASGMWNNPSKIYEKGG